MKEYKLGDIVTFNYGKSLPKTKRVDGSVPVMSSAGITGWHNKAIIEGPGVIVGRKGSIGTVFYEKRDFYPIDTCYFVTVNDSEILDLKFTYYLLLGSNLKDLNSDAAVPGLNREIAYSQKFKIPSKKVQLEIVKLVDDYNNLIENNNRRIAILEDMAQSLYREWFVNFRYPDHADALDASSLNALNESQGKSKLIESPLGQMPEGWEVKRLDDYVVLQRGFDLPKRNRNEEGGIPIYAASGITGYHDQVKAKGPGIVTGRSGTLGIVNLVLEDHWPLNTSLWVKEFKNCTAHYAYYLLDGIGLERFNSGASVPTLNRNDVHGNPVIAPPTCLIEKFESIASVNHKQIHLLKRKNENLKKQRDMLLPKLISGKIEL